MAQQPWRLGAHWERRFDVVLCLALLAPVVAFPFAGLSPQVLLFSVLELVPLFWRRHHPAPVFAAVAGASLLQAVAIDTPVWGQVAFPIALYSIARFGPAKDSWVALAVGLAATAVAAVRWVVAGYGTAGSALFSYLLTIGVITMLAWTLGTLGRIRQAYVDALVERGERLEREMRQQADLASAGERARIAREMHDVVAHGLSTIVVQADGARYAAAKDPTVAVAALDTVASAGREALTNMREMLGLLRSGSSGLAPQPGLPDVQRLVREARDGGMDLVTGIAENLGGVPEGVGLTCYRVAQEALTNVRRHAGPVAKVRLAVTLLREPDASLVVTVTDDGHGAAVPDDGRGLGLLGMRERVAIHGGEVEAGPLPGGGFGVRARIPL